MMLSVPLFLLLATFGSIAMLFFFFLRSSYMVVTISQQSMYPTLVPGDRLLALRRWSPDQLHKGQIVILKMDHLEPSLAGPCSSSSTLYIKRIVGVAGETFLTTPEGEERVHHNDVAPKNPEQHLWHIPASSILVRGDNRSHSLDSHVWGPIPVTYVQAVVLVRLKRNSFAHSNETFTQRSSASLVIGENAPAFKASTLQGETVNLQTYRGRHLLLVFFQPVPLLTERFFRHRWQVLETVKDETQIVLVSGSSAKQTGTFLKKVQVDLPAIIAPRSTNKMFQSYKVYNFPHYCYIDEHGKILSTGDISIRI
jgi:signal peptidase I